MQLPQGPSSLLRTISRQKRHSVFSRDHHPHLVVERSEYISNPGEDNGTLKVSGYVRGKTLSVNGVVYVPNLGEFQLKQVRVVCECLCVCHISSFDLHSD